MTDKKKSNDQSFEDKIEFIRAHGAVLNSVENLNFALSHELNIDNYFQLQFLLRSFESFYKAMGMFAFHGERAEFENAKEKMEDCYTDLTSLKNEFEKTCIERESKTKKTMN